MKGNESNFGVDWQGPVTEPQPESVEVPDTSCPFTEHQIHLLPETNSLTYLEGAEAFHSIIALLPNT